MEKQTFGFAWLRDPMERQHFFESYWERKLLHLHPVNVKYYDDVVSIGDLERLIASPEARYPAIQLSKDGGYFPAEVYCEHLEIGANSSLAYRTFIRSPPSTSQAPRWLVARGNCRSLTSPAC